MYRSYSELIKLPTFEDRFAYLQMNGEVGAETFGYDRIFNQMFYTSKEWRQLREHIIVRDNCCDLGVNDYEIHNRRIIIIHHLNPIRIEDIEKHSDLLLDPENLITTTHSTHNAIHYGNIQLIQRSVIVERSPNDTCPWKQ